VTAAKVKYARVDQCLMSPIRSSKLKVMHGVLYALSVQRRDSTLSSLKFERIDDGGNFGKRKPYGTYVTFSVWSSLDLFDWILDDDRKDRVAVAL
jgi:hypothetical protein